MKKLFAVLLCLFSTHLSAESQMAKFLDFLPKKCDPVDIIQEIPMIQVDTIEYIAGQRISLPEFLSVIDIENVNTVERTEKKLVCKASLVTEKGSKPYTVIFTKNSMGQIIVSY